MLKKGGIEKSVLRIAVWHHKGIFMLKEGGIEKSVLALLGLLSDTKGDCEGRIFYPILTGPPSTIGNKSDCRSRGHEFDPGPVPYFRGD